MTRSPWRQQEGFTAFAPFPQDSEMFGPPGHTWMINFRVDDLDAIVEQLRNAGETVEVHAERYPNGRFAELRDPEGNGIQLWQPMDPV
jgi:glyoxylase I family protein